MQSPASRCIEKCTTPRVATDPQSLKRGRTGTNGKPTAGIMKDTVIVPAFGRATVDLVADQPGLSLFHCHIQHHMDFGFKALFRYA